MSLIDLLRMSSSNLKRRKLRTFLTVLGVVIGTASIVVMVSLGLGMQEAMYKQIEEYGGLTTITVYSMDSGMGMHYGDNSNGQQNDDEKKYLTEDVRKEFEMLEHVNGVEPVLTAEAMLLKGKYQGWITLTGMTPSALQNAKIKMTPESRFPNSGTGELQLLFGNGILTNMYTKNGGSGYYETGELPNIDLLKDSMFLILDTEAYYSSMGSTNIPGGDGSQQEIKPPKKHVIKGCGLVEGGPEEYNQHFYNVYCDLDTLKTVLQKEFRGRAIPGQPLNQAGKPFKELMYSEIRVEVDDMEHVKEVSDIIRSMGYNANSNVEALESTKQQFAIVQAVLGGIGAVSLLVAAIGIANTMMMSIYERTKEIGIIKVLGCSLKNIRQMFLMEAAFIGLLGGTIGNILSFLMSFAINKVVSGEMIMGVEANISYIPLWLVLASLGFAALVGILAGYFPARRAMKLSALEAIRNN